MCDVNTPPGRLLVVAGALALVGLASGCAADAPASAGSAHAGGEGPGRVDIPSVYADSIVQPLVDGRNTARESYLKRLEICRQTDLPTTALADEELQKLGTTRLQQWLSPQKVAIRAEEWVLGNGRIEDRAHCQFFLASRGAHKYYDAEGVIAHYLDRDEVRHEPARADWHLRGTVVHDQDPSYEAHVRSFGPPVERTIAGQPCNEWTTETGTVCSWTGGHQWGFYAGHGGMLTINHFSHLMNRIVLAQEPAFPGMNRVELKELRIGEPLNEAEMQPRPPSAWPARKPRG